MRAKFKKVPDLGYTGTKGRVVRCIAFASGIFLAGHAVAFEAPSASVQLTDGTVVKGEVVSWDNEDLSIKSSLGTLIIHKEKLTPKTIDELRKFTYDPASSNREQLAAKVSELEETVGSLRRDNAALREQLSSGSAPGGKDGESRTAAGERGGKYWIAKSGKRHNENCRYYKTGNGKEGTSREGEPCKVCGG